jgi:hypothetical protein
MLGPGPSARRAGIPCIMQRRARRRRPSGRILRHAHFFARGIRSTESKGFNTENTGEDHGVHGAEKHLGASRGGWSSADAERHYSYLRALRDPRPLLRFGILAFLNPTQIRTDADVPRARQAAAGERGTVGCRTEPNIAPRTRGPLARLRMCDSRGVQPEDDTGEQNPPPCSLIPTPVRTSRATTPKDFDVAPRAISIPLMRHDPCYNFQNETCYFTTKPRRSRTRVIIGYMISSPS